MKSLEANRLGFSYGEREVFSEVGFALEGGTVTAILGANGCGKTTLLRCLTGLLRPDDGTTRIAAEHSEHLVDIFDLSPAERASRIGFVPQDIGTSFGYSALQMVVMGRSSRLGMFGIPDRHDEERARVELERLGVGHLAGRSINTMSGGERRLVLIARALVTEASVLLLDEPTAHLDFRNQLLVQRLLRQLAAERRMAIAFTTHLPTDAFAVATHAILMDRDGEHRAGPIEQVITNNSLESAFAVRAEIVEVRVNGAENHVVVPIKPI